MAKAPGSAEDLEHALREIVATCDRWRKSSRGVAGAALEEVRELAQQALDRLERTNSKVRERWAAFRAKCTCSPRLKALGVHSSSCPCCGAMP